MRIYVNYRTLLLSAFMLTFITSLCGQGTGFVTIRGKQFKINDVGYYPMVMNYSLQSVYNISNSENYLSPDHSYNITNDFECDGTSACEEQIQNDLNYIAGMGFNAVRICGLSPKYYSESGLYLRSSSYPAGAIRDSILINPSAPNDPGLLRLLSYYDNILALANTTVNNITSQAAPLKVIFVLIGNSSDFDIAEQNEWDLLFNAISAHMATTTNNNAFFAYDLMNEPLYTLTVLKTKQEACNMVGTWYNTIKTNDPNHFVTIGLHGRPDVFSFDPAILKLDFISLHYYPEDWKEYEDRSDSVMQERARNRTVNELYWMQQSCPMPWIIGETGFSAATGDPVHQENFGISEGLWGTLSDFGDYTLHSLNATCNCGASGYSWWSYQDLSYYGLGGMFLHNFFGLLERRSLPELSAEKQPAVNNFRNYIPGITGPCPVDYSPDYDINKLYYNPYQHPLNDIDLCHVSGTVTNQYGDKIKDAVVVAWTDLGKNPNTSEAESDPFYTFTDKDGYYSVDAYDYKPGNLQYDPLQEEYDIKGSIICVKISAIGAETLNSGWCSGYTPPVFSPSLRKIDLEIDGIVSNITISPGTPQNFKAFRTITTKNVIIEQGATADFKARNDINLTAGFDANRGSEVHVYCEPVYAECNIFSYSPMQKMSNPVVEINQNNEGNKNIEISFRKNYESIFFSVSPNPSNGFFNVQLNNNEYDSFIRTICILDITGKILRHTEVNNKSCLLDLSALPKGIYFLKAKDLNKEYNKKIIIN